MRPIALLPVLALATLLVPAIGRTQITQQWVARYLTPSPVAPHITTDASGNVIIAANTTITGKTYFTIIKYNSSGTEQWGGVYYTSTIASVAGLATDQTGNVYVTANASAGALTVKFSPTGTQLWAVTTPVNGLSLFVSGMTVDAAGNVYITGNISTSTSNDYGTVKLSAAGVQQWSATYNGTANGVDLGYFVAVDAAGNVYVTGSSEGAITYHVAGVGTFPGVTWTVQTGFDIVTIKYSAAGVAQWTNRYNSPDNSSDYASALAVDPAGDVYVAGQAGDAYLTGQGASIGCVTLAYTASGTQSWSDMNAQATYNSGIAVDPSGNVFTAGNTAVSNGSFIVRKFSASGSIGWTSTDASLAITGNPSLALDEQGNAYVNATVSGTTNFNYGTVLFTAAGAMGWTAIYNGPANGQDYAGGIAVFIPTSRIVGQIIYPDIYVTGTSDNGTYLSTILYHSNQLVILSDAADSSVERPNTLAGFPTSKLSNYPNPFRGATTIAYTLPKNSHVILQIYDVAGRPVSMPIDENETAGPHTLPFNAGRIVPGIYQYRIIARSNQGLFTETKQMIIQ